MKILVTGGTGFLGSHVVERLINDGHSVTCLVRPTSDIEFLKRFPAIEFCVGSLTDLDALTNAVIGVDIVIHCACAIKARHKQEFYDTNVAGTLALLNACFTQAHRIKRFVFISSLAAVGPSPDGMLLSETKCSDTAPVSLYGKSKQAAENLVLQFKDKLPVTIVRPPLIYGPRDKETLAFFKLLSYGLMLLPLGGSNQLSAIYAGDAANTIVSAMTAAVPSGSVYFISDGVIIRWRDVQETMIKIMKKKFYVKLAIPIWIMQCAALVSEFIAFCSGKSVMLTRDKLHELLQSNWICSNHKAKTELNWHPSIGLEEGIALTYSWYKNEKWL